MTKRRGGDELWEFMNCLFTVFVSLSEFLGLCQTLCCPVSSRQRRRLTLVLSGRRKGRTSTLFISMENSPVTTRPRSTSFPLPLLHLFPSSHVSPLSTTLWSLWYSRILCRSGQDWGRNSDTACRYPEGLWVVSLWGQRTSRPHKPRRGQCHPQRTGWAAVSVC